MAANALQVQLTSADSLETIKQVLESINAQSLRKSAEDKSLDPKGIILGRHGSAANETMKADKKISRDHCWLFNEGALWTVVYMFTSIQQDWVIVCWISQLTMFLFHLMI